MATSNHTWHFSTIGGVKRVNLASGSDLVHLHELDPKLWTALSCPVTGLEIDQKTLELIDEDKDGQIHVPDVIKAVNWILSVISNPDDLLKGNATLPLAAINVNTEQGKALHHSAMAILRNLGKENASSLTVDETSDTVKIFAGSRFNGDGVITEDSAGGDASLAALISDIARLAGATTDRNGKPGITAEALQTFFEQCEKYAAWQAKQETNRESILPFGADTAAAYDNYCSIKPKVDDFFIRCKLAAFDQQATDALNLQTARVENITAKDLSGCMDEIAAYPVAKIEAGGSLPLAAGINPAWEAAVATFKTLTAERLLPGAGSISEADWKKAGQTFTAYAQWNAEKDGAMAEPLGIARVRELLAGNTRAQLASLLEQDKAAENEADNIILVDKLTRYYRDLFKLLRNFVTFYDFYTPGSKAVFQAGTLYIDQRSCDLCIRVNDMGKQDSMSSYSGIYLLYCDCVSRSANEKMAIVAAITNGDVDDLMPGRNALFYDRHGRDWDATILKIRENPIGIRQAFFAPYRRLARFIEGQVNKAAAAEDEKSAAKMSKSIEATPGKVAEHDTQKTPPQPFDVGKFAGIFAAIGLAIGAIGTMLAAAIGGFMKLEWWKMPIAIVGLLLLISGPSMILAYLKLRRRNLAPILDANGWATNARVKINIRFGRTLTHLAMLPSGAKVNLNDPFTKKKFPVIPMLLLLLVIAAVILYWLQTKGIIHIRY